MISALLSEMTLIYIISDNLLRISPQYPLLLTVRNIKPHKFRETGGGVPHGVIGAEQETFRPVTMDKFGGAPQANEGERAGNVKITAAGEKTIVGNVNHRPAAEVGRHCA